MTYPDRVLIRKADRNIARCPQLHLARYSDPQTVTCKLELDKLHSRGPGYWKLNMFLLVIEEYKNQIFASLLVIPA